MTPHDPLKTLSRQLRDAADEVGDVERVPPRRDEAIARIATALAARGRARKRRRALRVPMLGAAAALLVLGAAAAVGHLRGDAARLAASSPGAGSARDELGVLSAGAGDVTALRGGHLDADARGTRIAEGTELRTGDGSEASLAFDSGTRVTLGGGSRVQLVQQSARKQFALEAGSLTAQVAKLRAGERFLVSTSDAEVEVRGTVFRVSVAPGEPSCEGGTPTRVDVTEGVVVVTQGGAAHRVAAGEHWPSCLAPTATASPPSPAPVAARSSALATGGRAPASAPAPSAASPSSHLAEQNDLFDEAMRRKRAGESAAAITQLDRLLQAYPAGALAETAAVERMRLLAAADPPRARAAARDYLAAHPRGYARAEAETLLTPRHEP
ncbi:MAG: hypothetical protein JWP97_3654 [Labilithrix sp.]|nr:hypothetical protein [Labilithrix sp.]